MNILTKQTSNVSNVISESQFEQVKTKASFNILINNIEKAKKQLYSLAFNNNSDKVKFEEYKAVYLKNQAKLLAYTTIDVTESQRNQLKFLEFDEYGFHDPVKGFTKSFSFDNDDFKNYEKYLKQIWKDAERKRQEKLKMKESEEELLRVNKEKNEEFKRRQDERAVIASSNVGYLKQTSNLINWSENKSENKSENNNKVQLKQASNLSNWSENKSENKIENNNKVQLKQASNFSNLSESSIGGDKTNLLLTKYGSNNSNSKSASDSNGKDGEDKEINLKKQHSNHKDKTNHNDTIENNIESKDRNSSQKKDKNETYVSFHGMNDKLSNKKIYNQSLTQIKSDKPKKLSPSDISMVNDENKKTDKIIDKEKEKDKDKIQDNLKNTELRNINSKLSVLTKSTGVTDYHAQYLKSSENNSLSQFRHVKSSLASTDTLSKPKRSFNSTLASFSNHPVHNITKVNKYSGLEYKSIVNYEKQEEYDDKIGNIEDIQIGIKADLDNLKLNLSGITKQRSKSKNRYIKSEKLIKNKSKSNEKYKIERVKNHKTNESVNDFHDDLLVKKFISDDKHTNENLNHHNSHFKNDKNSMIKSNPEFKSTYSSILKPINPIEFDLEKHSSNHSKLPDSDISHIQNETSSNIPSQKQKDPRVLLIQDTIDEYMTKFEDTEEEGYEKWKNPNNVKLNTDSIREDDREYDINLEPYQGPFAVSKSMQFLKIEKPLFEKYNRYNKNYGMLMDEEVRKPHSEKEARDLLAKSKMMIKDEMRRKNKMITLEVCLIGVDKYEYVNFHKKSEKTVGRSQDNYGRSHESEYDMKKKKNKHWNKK